MLLLVDVGNTNICFVTVVNDVINPKIIRINTTPCKTSDEYYFILKEILPLDSISGVCISSVVPEVTLALKELFTKHYNIKAVVLNNKIKTGVNIKADNPKEVGADLICDTASIIGDALVIDLGTAIKYIYVKNHALAGVVISPGVVISMKALVNNTALLPNIDIKVPNKVLGSNTITCMQSGVTYGVASQVDGMIERIKEEVNDPNLVVIATGGLANVVIPLCKNKIEIDELLTLKGLYQIYRRNI